MGNEIVLAHDNGIKIRIISDRSYSRGTGSQISYFIKEGSIIFKSNLFLKLFWRVSKPNDFLFLGIPVRMRSDNEVIHHKFIIVDGQTVLSGSLNWTMQSFFGNYENLLLITDKNVVTEFQKEFERLWESFPLANGV